MLILCPSQVECKPYEDRGRPCLSLHSCVPALRTGTGISWVLRIICWLNPCWLLSVGSHFFLRLASSPRLFPFQHLYILHVPQGQVTSHLFHKLLTYFCFQLSLGRKYCSQRITIVSDSMQSNPGMKPSMVKTWRGPVAHEKSPDVWRPCLALESNTVLPHQ